MQIACIGKSDSVDFKKLTVTCYSTLLAFLNSNIKVDAIILAHENFPQNGLYLREIRQHSEICLIPVFTLNKLTLTALCDGFCENEDFILEKTQSINERLQQIKVIPADSKMKFLAYCYSRAPLQITPQTNWLSPSYYQYPLAELFIGESPQTPLWLEELAKKNLINEEQFFRTQFICFHCSGSHLSFTERCPSCQHENVLQCPFLHCFTCGLIAPEANFLQSGQLKCPKCSSLLRHIGDDYDRPLESGECLNCHEYYQEAKLWVECMLCQKSYEPDKLSKSRIFNYQVTHENMDVILKTFFTAHMSIFDETHYVEPQYFMAIFDWILSLYQRYPDEEFGLIGVKFLLTSESLTYMHPFSERLKEILRKTDLLTHIAEDEIWLILPKTDEAGLKIVSDRIQEITNSFPEELKWRAASYSAKKIEKEKDGTQALAILRAKWL